MPNHVDIDLMLTGSKEAVTTLLEKHFTTRGEDGGPVLDCQSFKPYPEEFKCLDDASKQWEKDNRNDAGRYKEGTDFSKRPVDGYNSGGYEWCCREWGTKWGCYSGKPTVIHNDDSDYYAVELSFRSAWSPPQPIVEMLAAYCASHEVCMNLHYMECGACYQGGTVVDHKYKIAHWEAPYMGTRGG